MAYRPSRRPSGDQTDIGLYPLTVGLPLPIVPLALRGLATVRVDLDTTYATACVASRL